MNKFIIMSDLDGTLLNKKTKIPFLSKLYIKRLTKKGYYFVIATGRPYQGAIKFYNQLKLTSYMVCDNGGSIHLPSDHSKDIYASIPLDLFLDLINEIEQYIYSAMSSNFDTIHYYNRKDVPKFIQHLDPPRKIIEGKFSEIIKIPPINPSIYVTKENIDKILTILKKEKYSSIISTRYWEGYNGIYTIELFHKNGTKGYALNKLKEMLNINYENDLVFGDQLNDIEMIQAANNGVAMINGRDELKKVAKYISYKSNNHNGEINFIHNFLKNKKHQ